MSYSPENLAEIEVLMLFDLSTSLEGIKIHKTADPAVIAAAQRLFDGGFITQVILPRLAAKPPSTRSFFIQCLMFPPRSKHYRRLLTNYVHSHFTCGDSG